MKTGKITLFSSCWFPFWWLVIFSIHLVTSFYNAAYAMFYWDLSGTFLNIILEEHGIGLGSSNYPIIVYIHATMAAIHGFYAVVMAIGSLSRRNLVFSLWKPQRSKTSSMQVNISNPNKVHQCCSVVQLFSTVYEKLAGEDGFLSAHGGHFHAVLICRELAETALQTVQAVRMSKYLPRVVLNRFYLCLLAINCWSSVIINSRWFYSDEARRRFALVTSDCVLDLVSTIGVSILVVSSYIGQYDTELSGFKADNLNDDEWLSRMLNEAQMIVVVSWFDLLSRIIFSFGLVATIGDMKVLLFDVFSVTTNTAHTLDSLATFGRNPVSIVPTETDHTSSTFTQKRKFQFVYGKTSQSLFSRRILMQYTFAVWGIVLVVLHIHAVMQTPLVECTPIVYPMAGALPSCYLVNFNCFSLKLRATKEETETEWRRFDSMTVVKLNILHCQLLDVPDIFNAFSGLREIIVFNSTIVDWSVTAAVTNTYHPKLELLSMVRVNMTSGLLSAGLQSVDFPSKLRSLYFCETNLQSLPTDIDSKWIKGSDIYLQKTEMDEISPALVRLNPSYLILAGSPITAVPSELIEGNIEYLVLGQTQLSEFPQNVKLTTALFYVDVSNTNVSFFWSWIDPLIQSPLEYSSHIVAGGTKYCADIEKIRNGTTTTFSTPFRLGYSSILMNASKSNWEFLHQAVDCSPVSWDVDMELKWWDDMYGIVIRSQQ